MARVRCHGADEDATLEDRLAHRSRARALPSDAPLVIGVAGPEASRGGERRLINLSGGLTSMQR